MKELVYLLIFKHTAEAYIIKLGHFQISFEYTGDKVKIELQAYNYTHGLSILFCYKKFVILCYPGTGSFVPQQP